MKNTPFLSAIVAMDENRLIGKDNGLPWQLSADLKHFKDTTMHKPIVMGRKTWDSIGRPLPGRDNIVITRDSNLDIKGVHVVESIQAAIDKAIEIDPAVEEIMFMGGVTIYEQVMPMLDRLYITEIDHAFEGDAWLPEIDMSNWEELNRETHKENTQNFTYHFVIFERKM